MADNPYAPPRADVELPPVEPQVPADILRKIRNAWIAGIISASITLVFTMLAIAGTSLAGFTAWQLVDVGLMLGLSFGIYNRSRACAALMLVYFVISKILLVQETGKVGGIAIALVFFYYYAQGVAGTFAYHKRVKR